RTARPGRARRGACSSSYGHLLGFRLRLAADASGPGDAAGPQHYLLQPGLVGGGTLDLLVRLDQRLDEHLSVAPVLELVVEGQLQRADRGRVGDRGRVVEVVRVGRDLAGDQDAVDAYQLLDGLA